MDKKGMLMAVDGTTTPPAKEDGVWRKNAEVEDSMVTNRLYAGAHSQASAIIAWDSPYIGYEKKKCLPADEGRKNIYRHCRNHKPHLSMTLYIHNNYM